ncbi:MAG: hypothetical protein HY319_18900 [Armatimonadetes bacterium]|nr:hypothetical protein [Armatimonadota bacterium]
MIAIGVLTMILLTLIGLSTSAIRSNEKAALLGPATQVSDSLMNRTLYQVDNDLPAGTAASFWNASGPAAWRGPTQETIGGVSYEYVIYANTVSETGGGPLGGPVLANRVKKVDILVWWWGSRATGEVRQGYGRMQVQSTRLVNEIYAP